MIMIMIMIMVMIVIVIVIVMMMMMMMMMRFDSIIVLFIKICRNLFLLFCQIKLRLGSKTFSKGNAGLLI